MFFPSVFTLCGRAVKPAQPSIAGHRRKLPWIVCALVLGTAACSGSGKSASADTGLLELLASGGSPGMGGAGDSTGGAVATGGVVASGGVVAAGGSSIDAATSDVSATGPQGQTYNSQQQRGAASGPYGSAAGGSRSTSATGAYGQS